MVFAKPAEQDLLDIEHYICFILCSPEASFKTIEGILGTIEKLIEHPMRHPLITDKVLQHMELRMICFHNYNIFYHYDLKRDVISIIRILYNKVDWQNRIE